MISRYSRSAMSAVFAPERKLELWLRVERAALDALVTDGIAPSEAAEALGRLDAVDAEAVAAREAEIHHDLAAFVDVVGQQVPEAASWLHYGLTSSDVVDTALGIQLGEACDLLLDGIRAARAAVLVRAHAERDTAMLGRTHGMPAEPISFGAKLAGWWHQLGRDEERLAAAASAVSVGKLSGAVGSYGSLPPRIESRALAALELGYDPSATQVVQRDRHAQLLSAIALCGATLERCALEVRHLQRSEVGELSEPFGALQKGSSAMPHKRNPIVAERICGLARVLRGYSATGLENVALWHERDISHSSSERVILPDACLLLDYMLERFTWLVEGMDVHRERMLSNLAAQRGLPDSQRALLGLIDTGLGRDRAYRLVQAASASVLAAEHESLAAALTASGDAAAAHVADQIVSPQPQLGDVSAIFARLPAAEH